MKVSKKTVNAIQGAVTTVNPESKFDARLTLDLNGRKVFYHDANKPAPPCPKGTFATTAESEIAAIEAAESNAASNAAEDIEDDSEDSGASTLGSTLALVAAAVAAWQAIV